MTEFLFTHLKEIFVISLVVALSVSFVLYFVIPSQKILKKLAETISKLEQTKPNTSPSEVLSMFGEDRALKAIWREYGKTLHLQQEMVAGELKVTAVFSTVTSDAYFNAESVFEGRINSEFFKHLPGF